MRLRILLLLGWAACLAQAQDAACRIIEADRILARDLAAALPAFSGLPAETQIAAAPLPGFRRVLHAADIQTLAQRYSLAIQAPFEVCFEWAMQALDRDRVLEAMQDALQNPDAVIDIVELSSARVPGGRIDFPRARMGMPPAADARTPVMWRGDVVYGGNRKFAIWAKVRLAAPCEKLVASESLKLGEVIQPGQVRLVTASCFPAAGKTAPTVEEAVGMVPVRAIAASGEVRREFLSIANDVNRGDMVEIEVRSGNARLAFTGQALSAGRSGETITVRNLDSKKNFQARISGKGKAVVEASGPSGE